MRRFILSAFAAAGLLQGCATSQLSPTGDAVYYALQTDTTMRTWVDACEGINAETRQAAYMAQQNWWKRNGALVEGADFGLAYDLVQVSGDRPETGARLAMALTWQVVESAEQEVNGLLGKSGNREDLCLRVLGQYDKGERDLHGNEQVYNSLVSLQRKAEQQGPELVLKKAAVEAQSGKVYGRSYYIVEKMAQRQGCPGADVHLLRNAWPHEVYDARCPDNSYLIMRCEWGNCLITD